MEARRSWIQFGLEKKTELAQRAGRGHPTPAEDPEEKGGAALQAAAPRRQFPIGNIPKQLPRCAALR